MLGKLIGRRTLRRMRRMVAIEGLFPNTNGVANEVGRARRGSGHDALSDLANQQEDCEKG